MPVAMKVDSLILVMMPQVPKPGAFHRGFRVEGLTQHEAYEDDPAKTLTQHPAYEDDPAKPVTKHHTYEDDPTKCIPQHPLLI